MAVKENVRLVFSYWRVLVFVLTPVVLLPLPLHIDTRPANCAYVILITAIYWMTEVLPIGVTSFLPALLFPMLHVNTIGIVSEKYFRQTIMLFIGSLMVAVAVEDSNLHKRIALRVLLTAGTELKWLMLGCMGITAFLSMWILNTSTSAMMLPIMQAILKQLDTIDVADDSTLTNDIELQHQGEQKAGEEKGDENDGDKFQSNSSHIEVEATPEHDEPKIISQTEKGRSDERMYQVEQQLNIKKGFMLAIAYAANIGGTGALTGTGPNMELMGQLDVFYGPGVHGINFASWFFFGFPNMVLSLISCWIYLNIYYLGWRDFCCCGRARGKSSKTSEQKKKKIQQVLQKMYNELGNITFNEKVVLALFLLLAVLWITRDPQFIPGAKGWGSLFEPGYVTTSNFTYFALFAGCQKLSDCCSYVTDSTPVLFISMFLFILPKHWPDLRSYKDTEKVLNWHTVHHNLPWHVVILTAAGFAIAYSVQDSGLSALIGEQLLFLSDLPTFVLVLILCLMAATVTEIASNVAVATFLVPILVELSRSMQIHPLYLTLPTIISTSFAFMFPVATPPNALVFSSGYLTILDMVKCGFLMNVICILILQFSINTYGLAMFKLDVYPDWADLVASNHSSTAITTSTSNSLI